jgi:hypothetical protein
LAEPPAIPTDVQQPGINGNATGAQLGSPFGQSFMASSASSLFGFGLAAVDTSNAQDLSFSLWHTDAAGSAIVGPPLASGNITAAEIQAFYQGPQPVTPVWFFAYFDQPYAQTVGERLAFTVEGGDAMRLYFANGSAYSGGSLLGDASKDITFVTIVPEPSSIGLLAVGLGALAYAVRGSSQRRTSGAV